MTDVRRIVTGHDARGRAVVRSDDIVPAEPAARGIALFAKVWTTNVSPADNDDAYDGAQRETGLTCPGGTVLRFVDFPSGARSPMHRTSSIDYGIVLEGEIDLELDDGSVTHLRPGNVVVQRGTIHAWVNNSAKLARMAYVLIDAKPAHVAGKALDPV